MRIVIHHVADEETTLLPMAERVLDPPPFTGTAQQVARGADLYGRYCMVCHGDADPLVPRERVIAFWEEMDRAGANWHFHSYAGVKHGFTNPAPPPGNAAVAYDESADRQSWAALNGLLDEVFG